MKTSRWRVAILASLAGIAVVTIMIGVTYIPFLQLQNVTVNGTHTLNAYDIERAVRDHVAEKRMPLSSMTNVVFTRVRPLEERLMTQFPLDDIAVTRVGQSLTVDIIEKVTTVALRTKEKTVMLDVTGAYVRDAIFEESRAIDLRIGTATAQPDEIVLPLQPDMPIVINAENDSITELPAATAAAAISIAQQLPLRGLHAQGLYVDGLDAPYVRVETAEAYDIYIDIGLRTVEEQMETLDAIVSAPNFAPPAEYIDLRFGAYVYVK